MSRFKKRKGFTLIELLVVIAIIAILAAILFPVFSRARRSALSSACLSNEKQMGLALQQYLIDYDHTFPVITHDLYYGVRGGDTRTLFSKLYPYTKSIEIYRCPLVGDPPTPATYTAAELAAGMLDIPMVGYKINGNLFQRWTVYPTVQTYLSIENMPDPSTVLFISESKYSAWATSYNTALNSTLCPGNPPFVVWTPAANAYECYYGYMASTYDWDGQTWPHNGGMNLSFCDGHAEFRSRGDIRYQDFGMTGPSFTANYPDSLF